jgi:hypothetical protein
MEKNDLELREKLEEAGELVAVGALYTHYKYPKHTL